jgi:hypothetical protein
MKTRTLLVLSALCAAAILVAGLVFVLKIS